MIEQFLQDISPKGNIEFSTIGADGCKVISKVEALKNKTNNVYFLGGVKDGVQGRAKDNDIEYVSYIRIDIDIVNQIEGDVTTEEVEFGIEEIKEILSAEPHFNMWKYMIMSGRGCHLYYIGDTIKTDKETFSLGMDRILSRWDKIMPNIYRADMACGNIGRIMRLPGTINQKNGEECRIMYTQDCKSELLKFIPSFAKAQKDDIEKLRATKLKERKEMMSNYGNLNDDNNIYNLILDIPAYEISQLLLPQFKYTGHRNFLSDNQKNNKYTAFYYSEDKNIIINGGSAHYNWGDATSGWDSFLLVKKFMNWTNKETFNHFRRLLNIE